MDRRAFLGALAGPVLAAPALVRLSRKSPRRVAGRFVDDGGAVGHALREGRLEAARGPVRNVPVVIVGGGIAGLSAAWELDRRGMRDFTLLEMEPTAGGNARWGENEITAYPWAAHYVPVPDHRATLVRELFEELGLLRNGVWEERHLCFSPQERLFLHGEWHAGIEPEYALDAAGRAAFQRFDETMTQHRESGAFTIPMAIGARRGSPLDGISMGEWLRRERLDVPRLKWYVDYACRDDYGALAEQTSAWAGIHYFAARAHDEVGPLTWPEGNGWIARRLVAKLAKHISTEEPAVRIERTGTKWRVSTTRAVYVADAVVFAAPSFLLPHLAPAFGDHRAPLVYSPWITANLTLERHPRDRGHGAPLSWDNVVYDSPSLGYVDAGHQSLATQNERTVWTYYWALAEHAPADARRLLQRRTWSEWTELMLADLERVHPDVRECVSRIDVMRMGHAMVRPTVGFLDTTARVAALELPGFFLAHSDQSGLSLFEEAQYHGVNAARRALHRLGGVRPV